MRARRRDRPWVTVNFAITWDARISTRKGTPADFSSKGDKRRLLEIRAQADAVLVGAGTVAKDTMTMGMPAADLRAERVARGQAPEPLRVVLSNSGRIDPDLRLFSVKAGPIVIFTSDRMVRRTREALAGKAELRISGGDVVDLPEMMRALRRDFAVRQVDCEGGGQVCRSLLEADLVDELYLTFCPKIFGGAKAPTITGLLGEYLPRAARCTIESMEVVDGECFLRCRIRR